MCFSGKKEWIFYPLNKITSGSPGRFVKRFVRPKMGHGIWKRVPKIRGRGKKCAWLVDNALETVFCYTENRNAMTTRDICLYIDLWFGIGVLVAHRNYLHDVVEMRSEWTPRSRSLFLQLYTIEKAEKYTDLWVRIEILVLYTRQLRPSERHLKKKINITRGNNRSSRIKSNRAVLLKLFPQHYCSQLQEMPDQK